MAKADILMLGLQTDPGCEAGSHLLLLLVRLGLKILLFLARVAPLHLCEPLISGWKLAL